MTWDSVQQLGDRVSKLEAERVRYTIGKVTDTSPFTVEIEGGGEVSGIAALAGTYALNDIVCVKVEAASMLVMGVITDGS